MTITVADLRKIASMLFDQLEQEGRSTVEIETDYYWEVDRGQRHDVDAEPTKFEVGQLSEDWVRLKKMLAKPEQRIPYGLTWLAPVLREVGSSDINSD